MNEYNMPSQIILRPVQGYLLKPTQIFKSNLKVYHNFSQMQNQLKWVVKIPFNPYDQTKKQKCILHFYPSEVYT